MQHCTVLGTILFLMHINSLLMPDLTQNNGNMYSYANDTVAIVSGLTWNETYHKVNYSLCLIKKWLDSNLFPLNIF